MEHLPSAGYSEPIVVPYVCHEMYDGGSYAGYPGRQGFDKTRLLLGEFGDKTPKEMASFHQSWLYFGLLHEVFAVLGDAYDPWDFVRTTADGRKVVTTERLGAYVARWERYEEEVTPEAKQARYEALRTCFDEVDASTRRYCHHKSELHHQPTSIEPQYWPIGPKIALSILVLAETLTFAAMDILHERFRLFYGDSSLLIDSMQKNGWCPSVLEMLISSSAACVQMVHYATTLGKHAEESAHHRCSAFRCKELDLDETTYVTKHTQECPGCEFLHPPRDMFAILARGNTPVIRLREEEGDVRLELVESRFHSYVALSHVWSDGLGNRTANALPRCQLRRVQHLVNAVSSSDGSKRAFWWCDTLCVPLARESVELQARAIGEMRQIYEEAERVLVVDNRLMETPMHAPSLELTMRLKLSGWMRRLWTLQEGIVAREICVQFRDGFRAVTGLRDAVQATGLSDRRYRYLSHYNEAWTVVAFLTGELAGQRRNLVTLAPLTQWRATSFRADEAVVLANVMGADPRPILAISAEDLDGRMTALIQSFDSFPVDVLFAPPPHLSRHGWRWAPSSFLNCFRGTTFRGSMRNDANGQLFCPSRPGLSCALPGVILGGGSLDQLRVGEAFVLTAGDGATATLYETQMFVGRRWTNVDGSDRLRKPALILAVPSVGQSGIHPGNMAALVDVWEKQGDDGVLRCDHITAVELAEVERGTRQQKPVVEARFTSEDQKWLVY